MLILVQRGQQIKFVWIYNKNLISKSCICNPDELTSEVPAKKMIPESPQWLLSLLARSPATVLDQCLASLQISLMGVSAGNISHLLLAFSLLSSSVSLKSDRRSFPLPGSVFNQFLGSGGPKTAGNYTCKATELLDQQAPVGCRWCYYGACNSWQTVVETFFFFFLHPSAWPYLRWCLGSWDHSHKYRPSLLNVKIRWLLESIRVLDLLANYILGFFS